MTECEHSDLEREAIPEFSLHEFWVCSCGEVIGLCEDSPYPRKSDLRAQGLFLTFSRKGTKMEAKTETEKKFYIIGEMVGNKYKEADADGYVKCTIPMPVVIQVGYYSEEELKELTEKEEVIEHDDRTETRSWGVLKRWIIPPMLEEESKAATKVMESIHRAILNCDTRAMMYFSEMESKFPYKLWLEGTRTYTQKLVAEAEKFAIKMAEVGRKTPTGELYRLFEAEIEAHNIALKEIKSDYYWLESLRKQDRLG